MVMIIGCNVFKRAGLAAADILHKFGNLPAGINIHFCFYMTVYPVVHHHISDRSSKVYNRTQFVLKLFICMLYFENPACRHCRIQYISPVSGNNIITCSANQCDILYNHLSAYMIKSCQLRT